MKSLRNIFLAVAAIFTTASITVASSAETSTVAVGGYDVVAYHTKSKAMRGSGNHTTTYNGTAYLFSTKENLAKFEANPGKYVPAYGGYCAYGAAVKKKFIGDPEVWKVVDGTLYLNLNKDVSRIWHEDIKGNIKKADVNWRTIADIPAADL